MGPLSIGGLLIEVIAEAIGESGESSTKYGLKRLHSKKPAREDIRVVTDYQANLSKKYGGKSIHKYDVYALPLTLIPGDFKFHGQSTLAYLPERCIAIHGRPACGITTLLKRIMASTTVESFYIPIEIPLSERVDLLTVKEIIKRLLKIVTDETFELIEKSGRLCILFDGLNEVRDIYGISRQLSFLPEQLENSRFIVTSRSHELKNEAGLDNYKFYEIQPLSLDDQIEFIGTRIDDNITRAKLVEMFTERKHLRSICSNQLIFLMSMRLLGTDRIDTEKISEFYSKFLNWFLLGWEKRKDIGRMQQIMEKIAYEIVKSSSSKTYLDEVAVDQLWNSDPAICTKEEFNFLLRSGFIEYYRHGYRMFQETFQYYLLACWLIRNGVFPIHFEETTPGKWIYKDEFEITELVLKFYLELSGISNFGAGFEAAVSQSTGL